MSLVPCLWNNVYADVIAKSLFHRKTRRQKRFGSACWLQQFQNNLYIFGKNHSNLSMSSHNKSRKTEPLRTVCRVQSLLKADYTFGPKQIILGPI